jgi:hypothetical protein
MTCHQLVLWLQHNVKSANPREECQPYPSVRVRRDRVGPRHGGVADDDSVNEGLRRCSQLFRLRLEVYAAFNVVASVVVKRSKQLR